MKRNFGAVPRIQTLTLSGAPGLQLVAQTLKGSKRAANPLYVAQTHLQYAAAALQSRPKLKLHLVLDAPKVAIPAADAQGRATLALDFGRFIIQSGAATHSQAVCLANRRSG